MGKNFWGIDFWKIPPTPDGNPVSELMGWKNRFLMTRRFDFRKKFKNIGKKFSHKAFFKIRGYPYGKSRKNRAHAEYRTALRHIDAARRDNIGSTYIGRGRGRGYIGSPISYKIKLKSVFASKK